MDDVNFDPEELGLDPGDLLDEVDLAVLGRLGRLTRLADPVPEGLVERSLFAATLAALEAEVMELAYVEAPATGVRGDTLGSAGEAAPVEARTITFTHSSLTVMISLSAADGGRVRVDGWAAPTGVLSVELHRPGTDPLVVVSDEDGRFSFEAVERGAASLVVRRASEAVEADGGAGAVSTPVIEI